MKRVKVVVRIANGASVTAPRRAYGVAGRAIFKEGPGGLPDVILLSEVASVSLRRLVDLHEGGEAVEVLQYGGGHNMPEAAVAIVSRFHIKTPRRLVGAPATDEGGGIRERSWVGGRILGKWMWAGHAHPLRAPMAQARYIALGRALPGGLGADWNRAPRWMRLAMDRAYRGSGVLGFLAPRWWRPRLLGVVDLASDHQAVDVEVTLLVRDKWVV